MNLKKYKSVNQIPDRELLEAIFSNQIVLLRELQMRDFKHKPGPDGDAESEFHAHKSTVEMINKTKAFHVRVNDVLKS